MINLICETYNNALVKLLSRHAYVGQQLTEDENIILGEMTKSIVKPMNIFFTLKEHNVNHCITMTQVYNVKYAYRSSRRDAKTCTEK